MKNPIIKPIITERSIALANSGKFTFAVDKSAGKRQIKLAVEEAFNVKVITVLTSIIKGKTKRVGTRRKEEAVSSWKKALVKLESGQKIDLFELAG